MTQKIVIRVSRSGKRYCLPKSSKCLIHVLKEMVYDIRWRKRSISCAKMRVKAMKIAVTCPGVASIAVQGEDNNELVVKGECIDAYNLAKLLRQKVGYAEVLSVGPDGEKK